MMRMRYRFLAFLTVSVIAPGVAAYPSLAWFQREEDNSKAVKAQKMQPSPVPRPELLRPLAPDPATVYKVEPIPIRGIVQPRTLQQEQSVKAASDLVSRLRPIPKDRILFFGWMNEASSPVTFTGWSVFVQQAVPTPQGQLITLRVSALASTRSGDPIGVMNNFIEEYLWSAGKLQYLKGYSCPIIGEKPIISSM